MTEVKDQQSRHRLIDTEADQQCNAIATDLFDLPLKLLKSLAEDFANETSTKKAVELFVSQLDQNRKKTTKAYSEFPPSHDEKYQQQVQEHNDHQDAESKKKSTKSPARKKRRCKSPDFFLARHKANLRIVASKLFLIDVLKGHLLYDYVNDNLTQRHIPYDNSLGDRIIGIVIANFANKTPFSKNDNAPIEWSWQLRKRQELVNDLKIVVPNADQTFAVLRYSLPHYAVLDSLYNTSENDSSTSLDEAGEASLVGCARCGFEVPLAFSKKKIANEVGKQEKQHFYCLYCTSLFNDEGVLLPQIPKPKILVITKLLRDYSTSRYCGNINSKKNWSLKILSTKKPEKRPSGLAVFQNPIQVIQSTKTELHKYKVHMSSTKADHFERILLPDEAKSFFKDIILALRDSLSQLYDRMHTELIIWRYNEGITVYDNPSAAFCNICFTYCHRTFLLMSMSSDSSVKQNAKWILIPPVLVEKIFDWMENHDLVGKEISELHMQEITTTFPEILIYKQEPGEFITVPVGWGYSLYHSAPSVQVSFDWIERNTLHLCVLSYIYCWLKLTNISPRRQRVHLNFMTLAISELVTYKMN